MKTKDKNKGKKAKAESPEQEEISSPPAAENRESTVLLLSDIIDPPAELIARKEEGDTSDLENDMKRRGQLQSLLVRPSEAKPGKYELLSGHRRRKAMRAIGSEKAHVVIARDLTDPAKALAAVFAENSESNRSNLAPTDQARVFKTYLASLEKLDNPVATAAKRLGVSTEHIRRHLRLLDAPKPVLERLDRGDVSKDVVIALQQQSDPDIARVLAKRIVAGDIETAGDVKKAAHDIATDRADRGEKTSKRAAKSGKADKRTVSAAAKGWLRKSEISELYIDLLTQYAGFTGQIAIDGIKKDVNAATLRLHQIAVMFAVFGWVDAKSLDVEAPRFVKKLSSELRAVIEPHGGDEDDDDEEPAPKSKKKDKKAKKGKGKGKKVKKKDADTDTE